MARIASMSVYDKLTGREVARGDILRDGGTGQYRLICPTSPTVPGKSGKVYVTLLGDPEEFDSELHAHIFGVYVAGRMDCGCPVGPNDPGHLDSCKAE